MQAANFSYFQVLEDDSTFGYAQVTPAQFLRHIKTNYGKHTSDKLISNCDKMAEQLNPEEPIEHLWIRSIKRIQSIVTAGNQAIDNSTTIALTIQALCKLGIFDQAISTWLNKVHHTKRTWPNFQAHFKLQQEEKRILKNMTAQTAGYHGANHAPAIAPPTTTTSETPLFSR